MIALSNLWYHRVRCRHNNYHRSLLSLRLSLGYRFCRFLPLCFHYYPRCSLLLLPKRFGHFYYWLLFIFIYFRTFHITFDRYRLSLPVTASSVKTKLFYSKNFQIHILRIKIRLKLMTVQTKSILLKILAPFCTVYSLYWLSYFLLSKSNIEANVWTYLQNILNRYYQTL